MIIYGAGGHAKVVASILHARGEIITHVFDDDIKHANFAAPATVSRYDPDLFPEACLIIAIGDNQIRRRIASRVSHPFGNAIHPTALVDTNMHENQGVVIMHRAVIQAGSIIGKQVIINTAAIVDHDCAIGDFVHLGPGVTLCGNVVVGENTLIGAGSTVIPNIRIGKNCTIGAGTVVTRDIPDGATVYGNPGRVVKH